MNSGTRSRGGKYTGSLPTKGNICYVCHCRSRFLQKLSVRLSYFKIPNQVNPTESNSTPTIHEKWKENLNIKHNVSKSLRICELHFSDDCFLRDLEAELTGRPIRKRFDRVVKISVCTLFKNSLKSF